METLYNKNKSHHMHLGQDEPNQYIMGSRENQIAIETVKSEKGVRVTIGNGLEIREHITKKGNMVSRNLGNTFRTFMDKDTFLNHYKSMGRPHLEFAT